MFPSSCCIRKTGMRPVRGKPLRTRAILFQKEQMRTREHKSIVLPGPPTPAVRESSSSASRYHEFRAEDVSMGWKAKNFDGASIEGDKM
ncbi:uncharacterized protein STEHIDRAFT_145369 [Stereum hirsutum FP-91666 SS1]|uniref:uncharacterized protein n=1 Tax=Stereum hirsutum (strain FP-91666) TaxID=721885 RepID=UPI000440B7E1|nr:uncharacterized protein STEHIDRAFT_145369 [Stereum hirsutum FP-91666 SS1]EIM90244.1 hypothetical protein STEHIDRAFT_145369 [Stereum hirsutum FP-91666 SS1]